MTLLNVFAISGLTNGLIILGLGIFIISHNWRDKLNRLYFLIVIALSIWSFSYWKWLSSNDAISALFWVRMLSIGSTLIPVFYFHWVVSLLKIEKRQKNALRLIYILSVLFLLFSFSDLFISGVEQKSFFPFWPNPGILYHFYLIVLYIFSIIYSSSLLFKNYRVAEGENKKRLAYVLAGAIVAFSGGLSNFFLWYNIPIVPYGNFLIAFYPILFAYATIKYRLFDIRVITTELFTIAIWIFLLIKVLISTTFNDLAVNFLLFIAVVVFGILLIRSMLKEVKQKEEIEKLAKEVERAYEVEKKANDELKNLDRLKNDFLRQAQHDLRTPLTVMRGYSDLLIDGSYGKLPKQASDVIKRIQVVTQEKLKDINNFLDVEQFKMGKGAVSLKPGVELAPMLEEIINVLGPKAQEKGIYLKLEKLKEAFVINADREKLKAAIFNIIDNAVKYTPKGGVDIKVEKNKSLKIIVSDTGIGIPKDKIKNIFAAQFERTRQAEKIAIGSGVGLYLASQIIKLHNGQVWVESEGEGKGSTFHIELPVAQK